MSPRDLMGNSSGCRSTCSCSGSPPKPPISRIVSGYLEPEGVKPTMLCPCLGGHAAAGVLNSHWPCQANEQKAPAEVQRQTSFSKPVAVRPPMTIKPTDVQIAACSCLGAHGASGSCFHWPYCGDGWQAKLHSNSYRAATARSMSGKSVHICGDQRQTSFKRPSEPKPPNRSKPPSGKATSACDARAGHGASSTKRCQKPAGAMSDSCRTSSVEVGQAATSTTFNARGGRAYCP
mmetsp:Transcript_28189/g.71350  ORF Transcript_28189/g.71350 Transcript_28189/m.71350 type:complete len:234 (+) Transcript_28189:354-1055(+)